MSGGSGARGSEAFWCRSNENARACQARGHEMKQVSHLSFFVEGGQVDDAEAIRVPVRECGRGARVLVPVAPNRGLLVRLLIRREARVPPRVGSFVRRADSPVISSGSLAHQTLHGRFASPLHAEGKRIRELLEDRLDVRQIAEAHVSDDRSVTRNIRLSLPWTSLSRAVQAEHRARFVADGEARLRVQQPSE